MAEQVMRLSDDEVRPRGCSMCNSEENEVLRLKELPGQAHAATPQGGVHSFVLQVVRSQGQPLDRATREFMDSRFGYDFSQVKIHIDRKAALTAHKVNASAFTLGRDIVFAAGHYAPHTSEGKRLLAHELAHVIQQAESGEFYVQREELHLYDPSDNPLRRWGYAHHYCEDYNVFTGYCSRDKPGMLHAGIRDLEGVRTWINFFSDSYTLNAIYFHTHGAPGYVDLPDGGISTENVWDLNTVSEKIASNAKIGFFGCNVAEGQEGSDFLLNAGSSLLEVGGGIVYASDSITFSVPGIGQRRPIWSKIKVVCVDPGGDSRIC
uniref:DUF4157 domain-containing protein n=1 Tax=Desulfobacca acetoxidans TaxID=60893 RepID=A0A7V4G675_9BACT